MRILLTALVLLVGCADAVPTDLNQADTGTAGDAADRPPLDVGQEPDPPLSRRTATGARAEVQSAAPARCPDGVLRDAGACKAPDPCTSCAPEARCDPTAPDTPCRCRTGFAGDGQICEPLPEAALFDQFPRGDESYAATCARAAQRGHSDAVTAAMCGGRRPDSLGALLHLLGIGFRGPVAGPRDEVNGRAGNPSFALTIHSAAVGRRNVSVLNPRAVVFTPSNGFLTPTPGFVAVAFTRGEGLVEIMAHDAQRDALSFYLLAFELPCHADPSGCPREALYEQSVESGWTATSLYDGDDLHGTLLDCATCHHGGWREVDPPFTAPLMFEAYRPWLHWMRDDQDAPEANATTGALATFARARAREETYGGIPMGLVPASDPESLEFLLVANGYGNGFSKEFVYNGRPFPMFGGVYREWEIQGAAESGQLIQPPHPDFDPADPDRVEAALEQLLAFRQGQSPYPDLRDLFPPEDAVAFGTAVRADADAQGILVHACTQCHHPGLDPATTRARFNIEALEALPDAVLEEAIWRVQLPKENLRAMPPGRFRELNTRQREQVVEYLGALRDRAP